MVNVKLELQDVTCNVMYFMYLEHDHPYQAGLSDLARQQGDRRG
jgi:hypothetical protein